MAFLSQAHVPFRPLPQSHVGVTLPHSGKRAPESCRDSVSGEAPRPMPAAQESQQRCFQPAFCWRLPRGPPSAALVPRVPPGCRGAAKPQPAVRDPLSLSKSPTAGERRCETRFEPRQGRECGYCCASGDKETIAGSNGAGDDTPAHRLPAPHREKPAWKRLCFSTPRYGVTPLPAELSTHRSHHRNGSCGELEE